MIRPKETSADFLQKYFAPSLLASKAYAIDMVQVPLKLDQNEIPYDWPDDLKDAVLNRIKAMPWNRYPSPFADQVTELLAQYAGVPAECVLTSPGTNLMIANYIALLSRAIKGKIIIARPTFPLYESQCAVEGLSYEVWPLNAALDYDLGLLPEVTPGSLILFASPNNPVGNALPKKDLEFLLKTYSDSLILADEAYFEFADEVYTDLLSQYSNLIIVRTCSKTLGAAGLRLGYSLASPAMTMELKKGRLPYLLNQFTIAAATEMLSGRFMQEDLPARIHECRIEREKVYAALLTLGKTKGFYIKKSQANFFLVKWPSNDHCETVYQNLIADGILVRNISKGKGLEGCLRISLGTPRQNDQLLLSAQNIF